MIKRYGLYNGMMHDESGQDYWTSEGNRYAFVLYTDHIAEVCKLRDKLMECAKECSECAGNGVITVHYEYNDQAIDRVEECPDCADIRSVLA